MYSGVNTISDHYNILKQSFINFNNERKISLQTSICESKNILKIVSLYWKTELQLCDHETCARNQYRLIIHLWKVRFFYSKIGYYKIINNLESIESIIDLASYAI